jgi:hypothetical protein
MRLVGTGFPAVAFAGTISVRLTAASPIFADGTSTSVDVAATASTATTLDFVSPLATLSGVDTATVDLAVGFPDGGLATLPAAFTYQAPALAVVSALPAGSPGATGIANANLDATGGRPLHLFARGGGDPFVLSPAPGRTFGPVPVPAAGTVGGVVDVEFRTAALGLWPGNAEFAIAPGTLVSDGTTWLVRGASPGLLDALPAAATAPVDATVSVTFEDGTRQTLPGGGLAPGARLLRTSERLFTSVNGLARTFGQDPFVDGITAFADGTPAGAGPVALDAARNRLYVANGSVIDVFDTAQTMDAGLTPTLGPSGLAPGAPSPTSLALPGAAPTGLAVDARSGRLWAVNDLGVLVVDPRLPAAPIVTRAVPPGLGATTHALQVVPNDTAGEMIVSLFDGAGPGVEALLVFDASSASLVSVWRVIPMTASAATLARNGTNTGGIELISNNGGPNGSTSGQVASGRINLSIPAATGAAWNGELAVRPGAGGAARAFLLYDNVGANVGTVIAVNATNGFSIPFDPNDPNQGWASAVSISIPSDWLNTMDLTTGGSTAAQGYFSGAYPLGAGALVGAGVDQRGRVAYDALRDVLVVHGGATGGASGFNYVNASSTLPPGYGPPSGPPYSPGTFIVNGAALVTMITNATTLGTALVLPSSTNPGLVPTQDHLRVLTGPGGLSSVSQGVNGPGASFQPVPTLLANLDLGPARGTAQTTASGLVIDSAAAPTDGNWFLLGAPAAGDVTEARFTGAGATLTTSPGVGPAAPPAGGGPVIAVSAP